MLIAQPPNLAERLEVAKLCADRLGLTAPVLVDGMDNAVDQAYNAWPERLYVINPAGRVVYHGGKGPFEFKPDELAEFLAATLR